MIFDSLEHARLYEPLHPAFGQAFDFLRKSMEQTPAPGRYEIDGDRIYAMVQTYASRPAEEVPWEAHRKYIDIQFMLSGRERIGCADVKAMTDPDAYSPDKDAQLAGGASAPAYLPMTRGSFVILYPQDAHQPACRDGEASDVVKIVVKVLL